MRLPRPRQGLFDLPACRHPIHWPRNWETLSAQLARFFGWAPDQVWGLSGSEMLWWCDRANDMIAHEAEARRGR